VQLEERDGRLAVGSKTEIDQEEEKAHEKRMEEEAT
jgi:hypothetical protein